ncbi:MAG: TolC family protein [Lewinellaceae bacterium]|nr:TolC family protein [Lewinellaceae bacterium]
MKYLSTAIFLMIGFWGIAQKVWTLEECIQHAYEHNVQVLMGDINEKSNQIDIKTAVQSRFPNVSSGVNLGWNFGRTIDPTTNTFITETFFNNGYSLNSGVKLFNSNKLNNNIKLAKLNGSIAKDELEKIKQNIALQVASAFLNVVFAQENIKNVEAQMEQSEQQFNLIENLIKVGNRPQNDIIEIEAQLLNNEQQLIEAQNMLKSAKLLLQQLIMTDEEVEVSVPANIIPSSDPSILTIEEVYNAAMQNQYSLKVAKKSVEGAVLQQKIIKADLYPSIGMGASFGTNYSNKGLEILGYNETVINQDIIFNGNSVQIGFPQNIPILAKKPYFSQLTDNLSYGLGVSCQIPIYSNYATRARIEKAKLNVQNANLSFEQEENALRTTVTQALNDATAAQAKYKATQKVLEAQTRLLENVQKKYQAGSSNSFELANVKSQYESAQINNLMAKYDFIFKVKVIDFYLGKTLSL